MEKIGLFDKHKETFRDRVRENLFSVMSTLGVEVQMTPGRRGIDDIGKGDSFGVIDLPSGPIRWVDLRRDIIGFGETLNIVYYTDYGVPDPRIRPDFNKVRIKSVLKRTIPLVGQVVDLHWKGKDHGLGIIDRLNSDFQSKQTIMKLKQPIMRRADITIHAYENYGCWIISTVGLDPLSGELWNFYQAMALHLLAEWSTG